MGVAPEQSIYPDPIKSLERLCLPTPAQILFLWEHSSCQKTALRYETNIQNEMCSRVMYDRWLMAQTAEEKEQSSSIITRVCQFIFSPNFLSSHFAQTQWQDENRFVF